MRNSKKPLVSIVIPAYNEEKDIFECLRTIEQQDYPNIETIVVDDGSSDETRKIIKKFKKVKIINGLHKGPGYSRNLGSKKARGEILVFVDADMSFPKDYIRKLISPIIKGKWYGSEEKKQYASNLDNIWSKCWGTYTKENLPNLGQIFRAILKSKFNEFGGFDPKYGYADDMTFFFKFKAQSYIAKDAFCYHKNPESLKEVFKQSRWIGASLPNRWKLISLPILKYILTLLLYPLSIIVIPSITLYKTIKRKKISLLHYMLIFYTVRYFGTLQGIYRVNFKGINIR